jgi:hypothetical protein
MVTVDWGSASFNGPKVKKGFILETVEYHSSGFRERDEERTLKSGCVHSVQTVQKPLIRCAEGVIDAVLGDLSRKLLSVGVSISPQSWRMYPGRIPSNVGMFLHPQEGV